MTEQRPPSVLGILGVLPALALAAQPANAEVAQIPTVWLNPTPSSLEVLIGNVSGASTLIPSFSSGQSLIAEITNAQLALPHGFAFRQDNPTAQVTSVTGAPLDANQIQVVAGQTTAPIRQVFLWQGRGLVINLSPSPETTAQPSSQAKEVEPIERVVIADYEVKRSAVPDATKAARTNTPLHDILQSIQVVPKQVIEDQQATDLRDVVRNVSSIRPDNSFSTTPDLSNTRGFTQRALLRNGFRLPQGFWREASNLERVKVLKGSFSGTILEDVALACPPFQGKNWALDGWNQATFSQKRIQDADGDVLFFWAFDGTAQAQQSMQEKLAQLKAGPHWPQLASVKQDKVYEVTGYSIAGTITANWVLDDLFKDLVPETDS